MTDNKAIFEKLFNSPFADPSAIELLNTITSNHPYFSPAQFFLLQKTDPADPVYESQVVKTNILFNNPHWLHFQLQQTNKPTVVDEKLTMPETMLVSRIPDPVIDAPDDTDDQPDAAMEIEIEPMKIELKMPEEKANLDEAMLFEPMHMVDYFASQGIKLTDEVQMADKLGKQLKSFTEWLKTMKKIHIENEAETTPETNASIQTLAENSNAETEVLTESMAEVFVKQGKMAKAVEVYQKLSLLNPAKSAYFAAKIENLKGI